MSTTTSTTSSTSSSSAVKPSKPASPAESQATMRVAQQLVEFCRNRKHRHAIETLYADNAKHIEPMETLDSARVTEGKNAILDKSDRFDRSMIVHEWMCGEPEVNGEQFTCEMTLDATGREGPMAGQRFKAHETCLYTVKGGKVTEGKFFSSCGG